MAESNEQENGTQPEGTAPQIKYQVILNIDENDNLSLQAPSPHIAEAVILRAHAWIQRQMIVMEVMRGLNQAPRIVAPGAQRFGPQGGRFRS